MTRKPKPMPDDDPVERAFIDLCGSRGIRFTRPERGGGRLDFYLPEFNLCVEVKAHSCERLHEQLESVSDYPVIVLIGVQSVEALGELMDTLCRRVLECEGL